MSTATVVEVEGAVVDATVVVGTMVVVVEADVVAEAIDVLVKGVVSVVVDEVAAADVDETSVACPAVEQATISSRGPTLNRIGIP
jgi:hypothetical protein